MKICSHGSTGFACRIQRAYSNRPLNTVAHSPLTSNHFRYFDARSTGVSTAVKILKDYTFSFDLEHKYS